MYFILFCMPLSMLNVFPFKHIGTETKWPPVCIRHFQRYFLYWNLFKFQWNKMTSSNGNIFRVTGSLCGEITGHRWIPLTKASDAELWCFLWSAPDRLSKQSRGWWFETQSCHYDVTVINLFHLVQPQNGNDMTAERRQTIIWLNDGRVNSSPLVPHKCVSIGLDNGLSHIRHQAII